MRNFANSLTPDLILLSEPKAFCHDLPHLMKYFTPEYSFYLNSEDRHDPELPFVRNQAYGGTMAMWKAHHDAHITVHPVLTSSFLPVVYSPPGCPVSIHVALYLPTSGQETEFVEQIVLLRNTIFELLEKYPDPLIYLRGDSNVNVNNKSRFRMFSDFLSTFQLVTLQLFHMTYHHFMGNGLFDSEIDVIILQKSSINSEKVERILCSKTNPEIDSHHDMILSTIVIPCQNIPDQEELLLSAPKIPHRRQRVIWSNIPAYQDLLSSKLGQLRSDWGDSDSIKSFSILLQVTSDILDYAAAQTNKTVPLNASAKAKKVGIPPLIKEASHKLKKAHTESKRAPGINDTVRTARKEYRLAIRKQRHNDDLLRDTQLFSICTNNPSALYSKIRHSKRSSGGPVPYLTVGDKIYPGQRVADGIYDSISSLKTQDRVFLQSSPSYNSWSDDYQYILKLSQNKKDVPSISLQHSSKILLKMKPTVADFWSVTPLHFRNAGTEGLIHFNFLMNMVIYNINNSTVKEMNTVYALLLHKSHGKSRTSDRSYRTISSCPVLAKALDMYIQELYITKWNAVQAPTQYQGQASSHDLASLLVTESIQQCLYRHHKPIFILFLDAKSAFDSVVISFLIRTLFFSGMQGNALHYVHNRLKNRLTYCDWDKILMGPIFDQQGLEQGGCSSSDLYKIYNNELLSTVQQSSQGVDLGAGLVVSGVGQADDVALASSDIHKLFNILQLALIYCQKFCVKLCPDKTKLLVLASKQEHRLIPYNPISINGKEISFSSKAEHVGVLRSCDGNLPNLLKRFSAHRGALAAILFTGLARSHRGNTCASLKIHKTYALPVLLSGLGSLVLSKAEVNMLDQHYLTTIRYLIKTYNGTPQAFILFMAGSLPGKALLHLRMLSIFSMITRLPNDPLFFRAKYVLTVAPSSWKSWFSVIRDINLQYGLPHPLTLLEQPLSKEKFKKLAKSLVTDYWETQLRDAAAPLPSLAYFKPEFHSLHKPHPILWTPRANPYEVAKAVIQLRMLSGRYRVAMLTRHWSPSRSSSCPASDCQEEETLEHLLVFCKHYDHARVKLRRLWESCREPLLTDLITKVLYGPPISLVQFILDASIHPTVINLVQIFGQEILMKIFHLTRTWCYTLHRERLRLLGLFKFD